MPQGSVAGKVFIVARRERTVRGIWNSRTVGHEHGQQAGLNHERGRRERRDEGVGKEDRERGAGEEDKRGEPRECMTEMPGLYRDEKQGRESP